MVVAIVCLVGALKELEETYVVLAEEAKVLYLILEVCDALDTHTECVARVYHIGMDGNRVLDNGTIIAGTFFITGDAGEDFCSLTDEQVAHFMQRFMEPEDISQEDVQADTGFIFYPL